MTQTRSPSPVAAGPALWRRGGVIHRIDPRSFADANRDGIGNLPGITRRLDHPASLGGFVRQFGGEPIRCAFNPSEQAWAFAPRPAASIGRSLDDSGARGAPIDGPGVHFDAHGVLFARLD